MDWRNLERLPRATAECWEACRVGGRVIRGKAAVEAAVAKWHLLDPLMVSPPGSARFLPVLHVDELRQRVHQALLRKHLVSIAMLLAGAALCVASGYLAERPTALRAGALSLALAVFVAADYYLVVRRVDAIAERALFALWVWRTGLIHAVAWSGVMLAIGGLQVYVEALVGGHDAALSAFGAVRNLVGDEPWRVFVGPFLHGSFVHWFANFATLAAASAIASPLMGASRAAALFVCGSSFGALGSFAFEATSPSDAYVGVSAGIFALFGWCAGAGMRRPASFPGGFALTAAGFAVLNIALGAIAVPAASNAGHIAGWAVGVLAGVSFPPRGRGQAAVPGSRASVI